MQVAITGSTGLIGSALVERLRSEGHTVRRMIRPTTGVSEPDAIRWDPAGGDIDAGALEGVDVVINLAGRPIGAKRWTPEEKRLVRDSRVEGTRLLAQTLAGLERKPSVLVSASGSHAYGTNRGDDVLTEDDRRVDGFLPGVVAEWEAATTPASDAGIRTVLLRSAMVLHPEGPVLRRLLLPFKLGLGGPLGNGRQWWSWIAREDHVGAIVHLLSSDLSGPVNMTSPNPVRNVEFAKTLGRVLRRPAVFPVPKFAPRILLGRQLADELALSGQRLSSERLERSGYRFAHPELEGALRAMLAR